MSNPSQSIAEENFGSLFNRLCLNTENEIVHLYPEQGQDTFRKLVETLFQNMKTKILFLIRFQLEKSSDLTSVR